MRIAPVHPALGWPSLGAQKHLPPDPMPTAKGRCSASSWGGGEERSGQLERPIGVRREA